MSIKNWREWFVPPEEVSSEAEQLDQAMIESGTGHRDENFKKVSLKKSSPPRCAGCKKYMGHNDGMYILVSGDWRIHIRCFAKVLEKHFKAGELIDLTTGQVVSVDEQLEEREVDDS